MVVDEVEVEDIVDESAVEGEVVVDGWVVVADELCVDAVDGVGAESGVKVVEAEDVVEVELEGEGVVDGWLVVVEAKDVVEVEVELVVELEDKCGVDANAVERGTVDLVEISCKKYLAYNLLELNYCIKR